MKRRLLPKNVSAFADRHGKERMRYRKSGQATYYFKASFGTEDFRAELRACIDGTAKGIGIERLSPGSVSDLTARYYLSSDFRNGAPMTQRKNRGILEAFRQVHGERAVASATFQALDKIVAAKAEHHHAAARNMRKQLRRLFAYAVRIGMRRDNPMDLVRLTPLKIGPDDEPGHHTWTEAEIASYHSAHPIGTKARLALDLMLWTGCRRGDVVRLGRQHMKDGHIDYTQQKLGRRMSIAIAPQLRASIEAMPAITLTFVTTAYGKPFTANGFGARFAKWCKEAGLIGCSAHGLRKAISRRLADNGAGNQGIKSVTGHLTDSEVALYTRRADQGRLAGSEIASLSERMLANSRDTDWLTHQKTTERRD
jgi:integrase